MKPHQRITHGRNDYVLAGGIRDGLLVKSRQRIGVGRGIRTPDSVWRCAKWQPVWCWSAINR